MKKAILFTVLALFVLQVSCGSKGDSDSSSSGSTSVTIRLGQTDATANSSARAVNSSEVPSGITSIRVTVSASDIVTIIKEVSVAGQSSVTVTLDIPNGPDRHILVEALDASGIVLYSGESIVNLGGEPLQLIIVMSPVVVPSECDLYVDNSGNDTSDCTDIDTPCRTITFALTQKGGNVVICAAAGTYNIDGGESFPITLKAGTGILCQGASHSSVIISPLGEIGYTNAILGAADALVQGCSITGGVDDNGEALTVDDCILSGGGGSEGILLSGDSVIKNSRITEYSGEGDNAVTISGGNPTLTDNTVDSNWDAITITNGSPALSGNTITNNLTGISISNGSPVINGNNTLSCNNWMDLRNNTGGVINARNNLWDHIPPSEAGYPSSCSFAGEDICNTSLGGSVDFTGSSLAASPCVE